MLIIGIVSDTLYFTLPKYRFSDPDRRALMDAWGTPQSVIVITITDEELDAAELPAACCGEFLKTRHIHNEECWDKEK